MEVALQTNHEHTNWRKRVYGFIFTLLIFRVVYLWLFPLGLVHDEAYYWDWSRNLDWGYYSKPPMIAWLIGASTRLLGSSEFSVRLPAAIFSSLGLFFVYHLAEKMFSPKTGFWAVLLSALTPGNVAMGIMMTIDAPLLFFWSASLYCFWQMLSTEKHQTRWVILTSVCIGLGLLSKQTMFGFLAFGGLFVLISSEDRPKLFKPALWTCAAISLLFLTPVLYWNWQNDWITAQHTSQHFQATQVDFLTRLSRPAELLGGLFGVISPVTFALMLMVMGLSLWSIRKLDRHAKFLLCFSAIPLSLILLLSFKQRIELNWPAPFFTAAMMLVAAWGEGKIKLSAGLNADPKHLQRAAIVGACFTILTYMLPFALDLFSLQGSKVDAMVRLSGWDQLGEIVSGELKKQNLNSDVMYIVADGRALTAELSFYLENRPKIYLWNQSDRVTSQYDLWGAPTMFQGRQAIIITKGDKTLHPCFDLAFESIQEVSQVKVPINSTRALEYKIWLGENCNSWPDIQAAELAQSESESNKRSKHR